MSTFKKIIHLIVPNWHKWNPRKDLKSTSWFRLQNNIFEDPQFYDFDHSELLFFIYILSHASKKQSREVTINVTHALRIGRFQKETISSSLEKLEQLQCVLRRDVDETENNANVTPHNGTEHNEPNKTKQNADLTDASRGSNVGGEFLNKNSEDFPDTPEGRLAYANHLKAKPVVSQVGGDA